MTLVKLLRDLTVTLEDRGLISREPEHAQQALVLGVLLSRLRALLNRLPDNTDDEAVKASGPNGHRAKRGGRALAAYRLSRPNSQDEPDETMLIDLLADLLHWGAAKGVDVSQALATAQNHAVSEGVTI